ncbi:L,D-transpeptidase family protein [Allorhizobium sp. BGMRC 0089]|nr:L,D-transpeptidase family protein [Allorhizobium sonneratiae]
MAPEAQASGASDLQIIVSKKNQSLAVYQGDTMIASSRVSTGKEGHLTPSGIFSVIEKQEYHESNLYSNAPMPWMQRITWSGFALHEASSVPNYPASHGCVRLPAAFARKLYDLTELGAHVLITGQEEKPYAFSHANLFTPQRDRTELFADLKLRGANWPLRSGIVEVAMLDVPHSAMTAPETADEERKAISILITLRGEKEKLKDIQALLLSMGFDTGGVDGIAGSMTRDAILGFKRWKKLPLSGPMLSEAFVKSLYGAAGQELPPAGQIFVRENFKPLFDAPITIDYPDQPLGTYFLEATKMNPEQGEVQWHAVTLEPADAAMSGKSIVKVAETKRDGLTADLDRMTIPPEIRSRIEKKMGEGTSLIITDQGYGKETGVGTDFTILLPGDAKN